MLILQNISYAHPNKDLLFDNINLTLENLDKIALIGNNGSGKSTLLKIIARELIPADGQMMMDAQSYYVPQIFDQFNHMSIAQALAIDDKLNALHSILGGNVAEENFNLLNDDWTIEERCEQAFNYWQLNGLKLNQKMETLSGGQKTKVFLAGIYIHQPELVLLDEPSNHLDIAGRQILHDFIQSASFSMIIVSHDRKILNLLNKICELDKHGLTVYGGNYDFYASQKEIEKEALREDVKSAEKELRKAKEKERDTMERQQKLDARGRKKQEKAGIARIMMNTLKNSAERSTSKIKNVHSEKINDISNGLQALRSSLPGTDTMKFDFDNAALHTGKILFRAAGINFKYESRLLWNENLNFEITSGERISLKGLNGSGKTTLIKIILGELEPLAGTVYRADTKTVYIDQEYSLIANQLNVYEQAQQFNASALQEHETKIRLSRFLFLKDDWDKPCSTLSGGERMRLILCCLSINNQSPDMIILDEPTNNLDIQNIEILAASINQYKGTLIVVSHDEYFLDEINIVRKIEL